MKTIALIAQKGGVGKTTMAVNLAVCAVGRSILFDLDQQESAVMWADRRDNESPHVEFLTERRLPEALRAAGDQGFDLCFIDTPPSAGPQAVAATLAADLVLIPCRPSLVDLYAIRRTALLVQGRGIPAFVVFNAAPHRATTLLCDARSIVEEAGLQVATPILRERGAFRSAWPLGKGVTELFPESKAASEVRSLLDWAVGVPFTALRAPVLAGRA